MKQLIFRLIASGVNVFDVMYGQIVDGQFTPLDPEQIPYAASLYIVRSELLGSQGYIRKDFLVKLLRDMFSIDLIENVEMYPNFICITLKDKSDETKEEETA